MLLTSPLRAADARVTCPRQLRARRHHVDDRAATRSRKRHGPRQKSIREADIGTCLNRHSRHLFYFYHSRARVFPHLFGILSPLSSSWRARQRSACTHTHTRAAKRPHARCCAAGIDAVAAERDAIDRRCGDDGTPSHNAESRTSQRRRPAPGTTPTGNCQVRRFAYGRWILSKALDAFHRMYE